MDVDQGRFLERKQRQQQSRRSENMNDAMREKRKSEVMIAAQSLDSEVQSVKNLKRISIGSMDMLMDPELEYRVNSTSGKQEGRKSWTSGVPTRPAEEVESVHNRAAVRYTYPSRAVEGGPTDPDASLESDMSDISFDVTDSAYLDGPAAEESSFLLEGDTTDPLGSQKSHVSSSGRSISGVGSLKRGANNVALRKTSSSSETSTGSNTSLTKNLLWVPASQHPNVKPENYLELVQDTLHNIKLDGTEAEQRSAGAIDNKINKENEENTYRPRKNSSLVRKPSRLRKSYTEFEDQTDYQDVSGYSRMRSSEDLENTSSQTLSSTNSSRAVSLRDITDELTKISNNAGLTDSDAITLARTLSMAGSYKSDEPDDAIENNRGAYGDEAQRVTDVASGEGRQEESEFASNMFMKNGFVIPARSSLRRSKFNTYRVRSASDESLNEDNQSVGSASMERRASAHDDSSTQTQVSVPATHKDAVRDASQSSEEKHITQGHVAISANQEETDVIHQSRQQEHLGTPADQQSHDSKSPSKFIGEEGSNLTSPSTISDFQDIYDHYRQSSVDWEKELRNEEEFARAENRKKPSTSEDPTKETTIEVADLSADASADNVVMSKDSSISSADISTTSVSIKPELGQPTDDLVVDQRSHMKQSPAKHAPVSSEQSSAIERTRLEQNVSDLNDTDNADNRQVQKRGGWAIFNMGAKDFLNDREEEKSDGVKKDERFQREESGAPESGDFIKTSSHMRTEFERLAADRSNHSKHRHSPIFTESNKKEIFEESKSHEIVDTDASSEMLEEQLDAETPTADSSSSFSAQRLEQKFVNLFKRKGKGKASSNKTARAHKKLDSTKKSSNNSLPKFRRTTRTQPKQVQEELENALNEAEAAASPTEVTLGEPVDDMLSNVIGSSYKEAPENHEQHLSLQPAVSVQSTRSSPTIVVEAVKELPDEDSQDVSLDNEGNSSSEVSQETVKIKKQPPEEQIASCAQSAQPPAHAKPQPLPPRKLTFSDVKRLDRPNAPMRFTDSAFGFPLPMLTISTVIMFDQRLPINVERAIYRLSHLKLSDPKRELRQQVMLSNFMYAYLNLVNHTLYMEQVAQDRGHEASEGAPNTSDATRTGSGPYTTDQNDANGAICIPDI